MTLPFTIKSIKHWLTEELFMSETNQIQIFQTADGKIELNVSLQEETVWLSQRQIYLKKTCAQ